MLRIDRVNYTFSLLTSPSLADASITERYGLQEFIANSPAVFFRELGLELFLLGKEVLPSRTVQDRIDLLCVDKEGAIVIVELKRGSHKLQLLQSISYAAMISKWSADEILALLDDDTRESLTEFLDTEVENINHIQKIVLVAEAYDYAVLVSAEWLAEVNGIDISCCRIAIAKDEASGVEYLVCSNVYPTPELADEAVRRGRERVPGRISYEDWDVALESIDNPEVVQFVRNEVAAGTESNLQKRHLYFRHAAKRRYFISARKAHSYCWQYNRFDGDLEYWKRGLTNQSEVKVVADEKSLAFLLVTREDYDYFKRSIDSGLAGVKWVVQLGNPTPDASDLDNDS